VTWSFVFVAALLLGTVLAGVSGLPRDLRGLSRHRHLVVPNPEQHSPFLDLLGRRLAIGLVLFGVAGLVVGARGGSGPRATAAAALTAGVVGTAIGFLCFRRRAAGQPEGGRAVVVRDIPAGGFGQVRLERRNGSVLLAARSLETVAIPAGCEVEVIDATLSVVTVCRPTRA